MSWSIVAFWARAGVSRPGPVGRPPTVGPRSRSATTSAPRRANARRMLGTISSLSAGYGSVNPNLLSVAAASVRRISPERALLAAGGVRAEAALQVVDDVPAVLVADGSLER